MKYNNFPNDTDALHKGLHLRDSTDPNEMSFC